LYEQAEHNVETLTQVQALSKFFKTLKEFERISGVASVQNYLVNLPALMSAGTGFEDASLDISDTLVNVLSVHRAKGLEWDTVYIIDCTEGSFPMQRKFGPSLEVPIELKANHSTADEHMPEERRLMYVAVTRAKHELILTSAAQHSSGAKRKPSRFLSELFGETPATIVTSEAQTSLELFAPRDVSQAIQLPGAMMHNGRIRLSVSQIDCYLRCPQDFYYLHVLQMPVPAAPALKYGSAIHKVIEELHKGVRSNNMPLLDDLLAEVRTNLPMAGYISVRSRERAHAQAEETVRALYEHIPTNPQPIEIEKPFAVDVPGIPLEIIGRIDAVYQTDKGIEIRDFKTGTSANTVDKAKSRTTSSQQLSLYALAWRIMHDEMPALLTLDFVETGQSYSVRKQVKSLDTLTAKLADMVQNLQANTYEPGKEHSRCKHPL
jgi:DNA helicase-2/ATP-dependent DNA helicase PcrA